MRGAGRAVNSEVLYLVVSARFVAIYDLEDATRPFSSPEYEAAVGWDEHAARVRGYHGFRIYRLSFEIR